MATSDKILHAANVLVCAAGVGVAPTLPAKAALFVRGLQSLREVFRQNPQPEITTLTETVAARIGEISEGRAEGDPRIQLPDMIISCDRSYPATG